MQGEGMNINLNHIIDQVVKDKGIDPDRIKSCVRN